MARTKQDIASLALKKLCRVASGQAATGSDNTDALQGVEHAHAELGRHQIAWWAINEVPDEVGDPLAEYVAGLIADQFLEPERASYHKAQMGSAMRRMKAVTIKRDYSDCPTEFQDF